MTATARPAASPGSRHAGWHPFWSLSRFEEAGAAFRGDSFGMNAAARGVRYPLRAMRYWFMDHLIRREIERQGRPLRIMEIGVDTGQMLAFMNGVDPDAGSPAGTLPSGIARWDAVTLMPDRPRLAQIGYDTILDQNVETTPFPPAAHYDIAILLHVVEHLNDPEAALMKTAGILRAGGIAIGGYPSVPDFARRLRERQLRDGASRFGHVSKFSPTRTRALATHAGLELDWISGAFLRRSKGSRLENSKSWTRLNLAFGAMFPAWPGENYWQMRKPMTRAAAA